MLALGLALAALRHRDRWCRVAVGSRRGRSRRAGTATGNVSPPSAAGTASARAPRTAWGSRTGAAP